MKDIVNMIRYFFGRIPQLFGNVVGLIFTALKVLIVMSLIEGAVTGNWGNLFACGFLLVFIVLVSRLAGNHVAFLSTFIPFAGELFDVDPAVIEKGERFKKDFDPFKK